MRSIVRREFGLIRPDDDDVGSRAYARLQAFALEEHGAKCLVARRDHLKIRNAVGVVQAGEGVVLEILPKIAGLGSAKEGAECEQAERAILERMLLSLGRMRGLRHSGAADLTLSRLPLYEYFITQFVHEVEGIVRAGLTRLYLREEANLGSVRGKIVFAGQMRENIAHRERFYVAYDEFSEDIALNRLLRTALDFVARISCSALNQRRIRELLFVFAEVRPVADPAAVHDRVVLDRSSQRYKAALGWAMLFLTGHSPGVYHGRIGSFAILYQMQDVFECHVASCLLHWGLFDSLRIQPAPADLVISQGAGLFRIRPDMIGRMGKHLFVIDTKWKALDEEDESRKFGISQTDLYQLLSYATILRTTEQVELITLVLIYPRSQLFASPLRMQFNDREGTEVLVLPFDIPRAVTAGQDYGQELRNTLLE